MGRVHRKLRPAAVVWGRWRHLLGLVTRRQQGPGGHSLRGVQVSSLPARCFLSALIVIFIDFKTKQIWTLCVLTAPTPTASNVAGGKRVGNGV